MKMRLAVSFLFWVALVWPPLCAAENTGDYIEVLSSGSMNWTRGAMAATGTGSPQQLIKKTDLPDQLPVVALQQAKTNILKALGDVRMDTHRFLFEIIAAKAETAAKVAEMVETAAVIAEKQLEDGGFEYTIQISLLGGFSQLILPAEIAQVEPIKAINGALKANSVAQPSAMEPIAASERFSGLIVDARGTGARPALVPVIVDETGMEVYGPAYVSREYAVQIGVCGYSRSLDPSGEALRQSPRLAPNPLIVKGLRSFGTHQCNVVISNADALKLRDASSNLHFLKQCRVMIVLD